MLAEARFDCMRRMQQNLTALPQIFPPPPHSLSIDLCIHLTHIFSPTIVYCLHLSPLDQVGNFIEDSPSVDGSRISIRIKFGASVQSARCSLTGLPDQDCKKLLLHDL